MRLLRFLFRNWPLKLGAIALAIILYVGMVALQNAQSWPGQVAIDPINKPLNSVLLASPPLPKVGNIRFVAPPEVSVTKDSFQATVDLSQVQLGATTTTQFVRVQLTAVDNRIQILDFDPQQIRVTLDPVVHRQVPVRVDYPTPPVGLTIGGVPQVSATEVDAFGPSSSMTQVSYARARVSIDSTGLDVDQDVDLVAYDANGNQVTGVEFNPRIVHVKIQVDSQLRRSTVPVTPTITGSPAAGYYVWSVDVKPAVVEIEGEADALAKVQGRVSTKPVSVAGATSDVTSQVALDLPPGVDAPDAGPITVTVRVQSPPITRTYTVAISPDGARPDRLYNLSVNSLTVTLGGSTAALDALDTSSLVATASVGNLDVGQHAVKISINVPAGIKITAQSLGQINVLVQPAPTPAPVTPPPATPSPSVTPGPSPS